MANHLDSPNDLRARVHPTWIPALLIVSVVGAFGAGRYVGARDEEEEHSQASAELFNQYSVDTLFMLNAVMVRLQESKLDEASVLLRRYAQMQVPGVIACSKSPICTLFAGSHMPSTDDLRRIGQLGDPTPPGHGGLPASGQNQPFANGSFKDAWSAGPEGPGLRIGPRQGWT